MILDTTFLMDLLRGKNTEAVRWAEELDSKLENKGVAAITVTELWKGTFGVQNEKEKKRIKDLLASLLILPFGEKEAKKAGEIESELVKRGDMIDLEDIMIAAVALSHGERVLTRNLKTFQKIKGIGIEKY